MENNELSILELSNLSCGYKTGRNRRKTITSNITLSATKSELIAILGSNGIGKSTLLKTIANLIPSLSGDISIKNKSLKELSLQSLAALVSFVSTEKTVIPHLKFYELVSMGRHPYTNWGGSITSEDEAIIQKSIDLVKAGHLKDSYIDQMSDGEKQKAYIARALAQQTSIMLLDEPTAFLDISAKYNTVRLLSDLTKKEEKTILFSTHDLEIALAFADKIWFLTKDTIVAGAPEDLILQGHFQTLLEPSGLTFDKLSGKIVLEKTYMGKVKLTGTGKECLWTTKALRRIGYELENEKNGIPEIVIEKNQGKISWMIKDKNTELQCNTLYDLCVYFKMGLSIRNGES